MYPRIYFRGNNSLTEYTRRKNENLREVAEAQEYFEMHRPDDNNKYDNIDIMKEMRREGWNIETLPDYRFYLKEMISEFDRIQQNMLMDPRRMTLEYMKGQGWDVTPLL
eukprot:scaffold241741_cov28-Tisochrysis_lutea.AAC.1